jgi:hypothetical protein
LASIVVAVASVSELLETALALQRLRAIGQRQSRGIGCQDLAPCKLLCRGAAVA